MFNTNHPAYTGELWNNLVRSVGLLKKNFNGHLNGFDKKMIKRQMFHLMFLEQNENDPFETISYNDHEYLNEYTGFSELFVRFTSSGLAEFANMSFEEFIKYPNWFADWILDWSIKSGSLKNQSVDNVQKQLEREVAKEMQSNKKKHDPFSQY